MTSPRPAFRPCRPDDLAELQRLRASAFQPVFRSFADCVGERIAVIAFARADAEQARLLERICREGSGHEVLVATVGGAIVGFVAFTLDVEARIGEIGLNAVDPAHAGRGIGTRMYEHVLGIMKARGMAVATVSTGGDPAHAPARRAYEKAGFGAPIPSVALYRLL